VSRDTYNWTTWLLWANIGVGGLSLLAHTWQALLITGIQGMIARGGISDGEQTTLEFSDRLTTFSSILELVVLIVTAVLFLVWYHAALTRLRAGGQPVSVSPGWAVGMWFVPIINVWRPFQIVREAAHLPNEQDVGRLRGWWGCWLVGNWASNAASRLPDDTLSGIQIVTFVYAVTDVLNLIAAFLLIGIVRRIQARLDALPPTPGGLSYA
jgi:Domain of unknown function (DUF4328)